ncbi:inositol-trisphosphate 3-kinase A-like [Schistocerca nitens]|uniref:inositol-trisphosphate 3-kinase A-like n=1 Tax=Schistocerca nitens TaxID=7011 RepID=UPI0021185F84|nr:inositol-trisphosphate 3-kinase A-like [Schistocerca nitens]
MYGGPLLLLLLLTDAGWQRARYADRAPRRRVGQLRDGSSEGRAEEAAAAAGVAAEAAARQGQGQGQAQPRGLGGAAAPAGALPDAAASAVGQAVRPGGVLPAAARTATLPAAAIKFSRQFIV